MRLCELVECLDTQSANLALSVLNFWISSCIDVNNDWLMSFWTAVPDSKSESDAADADSTSTWPLNSSNVSAAVFLSDRTYVKSESDAADAGSTCTWPLNSSNVSAAVFLSDRTYVKSESDAADADSTSTWPLNSSNVSAAVFLSDRTYVKSFL